MPKSFGDGGRRLRDVNRSSSEGYAPLPPERRKEGGIACYVSLYPQ